MVVANGIKSPAGPGEDIRSGWSRPDLFDDFESKTGLTVPSDCTINRMLAIFRHTETIDAEVDDG
jgi:hypothetical protein